MSAPIDDGDLLASTRSARRTLDLAAPVDLGLVASCLRVGLQAANGSNHQSWKWIVVVDQELRGRIAALYRESYLAMTGGNLVGDLFGQDDFGRVMSSTEWLVEHLAEVPIFVIPCFEPYVPRADGDALFHAATIYGSIFPAAWNFQLALRREGYGTCITTLHLLRAAAEAADLLGVPDGYVQGCLMPVAKLRTTTTRPAVRKPLAEVTALDGWDGPGLAG